MEVLREPQDESFHLDGSIATIGTYDGIHFGHRMVVQSVMRLARERDLPSVVVTFDRHPISVVRPGSEPLRLTTQDKQIELLAALGLDVLYVLRFDEERAAEEAEDFIDRILGRRLGVRHLLVGDDFRFGHRRRGNLAMLAERGRLIGMVPETLPLVRVSEVFGLTHRDAELPVSSSLIRGYLADGLLAEANALLGRDHGVEGVVVGGDRRGGGELGYPTANLEVPSGIAIPSDGVYAGYLVVEGRRHQAAISVGTRPTYYPHGGPRLIESFVLDYSGDLYGKVVEVCFSKYLRRQSTFGSTEELKDQIKEDVAQVRATLG